MKFRRAIALAGPLVLIASEPSLGEPAISAVVNTTNSFLTTNGLQSATIQITGFETGTSLQGFLGTAAQPWNVITGDGSGFFNIDSVLGSPHAFSPLFFDSFYAAPSHNTFLNTVTNGAAPFDSGALGSFTPQPSPSNFGEPAENDPEDDAGLFGLFAEGGSNDISIDPLAWISIQSAGFAVGPTSNLHVLRITWSAYTSATVSFTLMMNTPSAEIPMSLTIPAAPGPGGLALLALAGAMKSRRRHI